MQNFIKEQWTASWSVFNGFVQMRSALEIFSCCKIMRRPQSCKYLPIFDPKQCYAPLSPSVLSRFISARLPSVPQVENEVKRTPLCVCCWDPRSHNWWIKEGQERGIFGNFSEIVHQCKSLYICQWSFLRFKKKSVLKLLDHTVYI